jgi:hypothetical protein
LREQGKGIAVVARGHHDVGTALPKGVCERDEVLNLWRVFDVDPDLEARGLQVSVPFGGCQAESPRRMPQAAERYLGVVVEGAWRWRIVGPGAGAGLDRSLLTIANPIDRQSALRKV